MTRKIRNLTLPEIATLLDWASAEGWNPGINDAPAFHAADPVGFFGAFIGGRLVAGIAAVAYDTHFGFIGLYICHPDWRGQGHGQAVWDAGMAYLGSRTIGLDGVPEQQANYASMGFVPVYETIRMSGTLVSTASLPAAQPEDIRNLDIACFPARREAFLRHWLARPNRSAIRRSRDAVDAYAVLRSCRDGAKIGPLFARSVEGAIDLLETFSGRVHIDVPATQTHWLDGLAARGFSRGFRTARMYRGRPPGMALDSAFGITSLELG